MRFINQHLEHLETKYQFHGAYALNDNLILKEYVPGAEYDAVLLFKKAPTNTHNSSSYPTASVC
jgi:hypothetical protein